MKKECVQTVITFNWELSPIEEKLFDYVIVISLRRKQYNEKEYNLIKKECVWCKFPPVTYPLTFSDVSGTLGLLWALDNKVWPGERDKNTNNNASIFERTLADTIMKFLSCFKLDENKIELICIQGPMIPKLRGRIMYRSFPENVYVFTTTYDELWFHRISAIMNFEEDDDIYPPKALDHTSRMWFHCPEISGKKFHVELISNCWDTANKDSQHWLLNGVEIINDFLSTDIDNKERDGYPKILSDTMNDSKNLIDDIRKLNKAFSISRKQEKKYDPNKVFYKLNKKDGSLIVKEIFPIKKQSNPNLKTKVEKNNIKNLFENENQFENKKGILSTVGEAASKGNTDILKITHENFFDKVKEYFKLNISS